jgi:hypothetical protein
MSAATLRWVTSIAIGASLAGCVGGPAVGPSMPTDASTTLSRPTAEQPTQPPFDESFATYAVTKSDIRDRALDWELEMSPPFDAYDAASTSKALGAAARDVLAGCQDQQQWLDDHTDFDPRCDEPMSLSRDAVDQLCTGAANVVTGLDRGDPTLTRKGEAAIKAAREMMSSADYLGAWGPLLIH